MAPPACSSWPAEPWTGSGSDTEFGAESSQKRGEGSEREGTSGTASVLVIVPKAFRASSAPARAPKLINSENQRSTFEELMGFIRKFMNWVAPHLANREVLH